MLAATIAMIRAVGKAIDTANDLSFMKISLATR
jgi:hypothetical protein